MLSSRFHFLSLARRWGKGERERQIENMRTKTDTITRGVISPVLFAVFLRFFCDPQRYHPASLGRGRASAVGPEPGGQAQ